MEIHFFGGDFAQGEFLYATKDSKGNENDILQISLIIAMLHLPPLAQCEKIKNSLSPKKYLMKSTLY